MAVSAGSLWGMLLVVPQWLSDFSVADITFARYVGVGGVALLLLMLRKRSLRRLDWPVARRFLGIALFGNLLFYLALVASMPFLGPVPACLLTGVLMLLVFPAHTPEKTVLPTFLGISSVVLAVSASAAQLPEAHQNGLFPGILLLLVATFSRVVYSRLQSSLTLAQPGLGYSDFLLVTGLMVMPVLLLMLPLLVLHDEVFGLFQGSHSKDRWQTFWWIAGVSGVLFTLVP
ncbi:MAG: hypothetical protein ACPG5T_05040, partial [Endozoicomonas sp.]